MDFLIPPVDLRFLPYTFTANLYDNIRRKPDLKAAKKPQQKQKLGLRVVVFIYLHRIPRAAVKSRPATKPTAYLYRR